MSVLKLCPRVLNPPCLGSKKWSKERGAHHVNATAATRRSPKPFWWRSNTNTEVMAERSMHFIRAAMDKPLAALLQVNSVAWADLRG